MKILLLLFVLASCSTPQKSFKQDLKESVIDGFFDGDTIKAQPHIAFIKNDS